MRDLVENQIAHFKKTENQLEGEEWSNIYFTGNKKTVLVKDVDYLGLNEVELLRFLLYLTKQQDRAIDSRIRKNSYDSQKKS